MWCCPVIKRVAERIEAEKRNLHSSCCPAVVRHVHEPFGDKEVARLIDPPARCQAQVVLCAAVIALFRFFDQAVAVAVGPVPQPVAAADDGTAACMPPGSRSVYDGPDFAIGVIRH